MKSNSKCKYNSSNYEVIDFILYIKSLKLLISNMLLLFYKMIVYNSQIFICYLLKIQLKNFKS